MGDLTKIVDSYKILISSQHSYLMSLYDALISSIDKNENKVFIVDLFDQLFEQINRYYETAEVFMQITLHDEFLDSLESKRDLGNDLSALRDNIYQSDKREIRERVFAAQQILAIHYKKLQETIDILSREEEFESLLPPDDVIGIETIDYQHDKIMEIIMRLIKTTDGSYNKEHVNDLFHILIQKTRQHFAFEEYYFTKYDYPNYLEHRREHNTFIKNLIINKNKIYTGVFDIDAHDYFNKIKQATINHIEQHDAKYSDFLKEKLG